MPDRPSAIIELHRHQSPISGTVRSPRRTLAFTGWTGLLAALENALGLRADTTDGSQPTVGTEGEGDERSQ